MSVFFSFFFRVVFFVFFPPIFSGISPLSFILILSFV